MKYSKLCFSIIVALISGQANAEDYFNYRALEIEHPQSLPKDLHIFSEFGRQAPGKYHVSIYLNQEFIDTRDINFVSDSTGGLHPQLSREDLYAWGVRPEYIIKKDNNISNKKDEVIENIVKGAQSSFNFSKQQLDISIPQAYINQKGRGYVNPALWDEGVPAFLLSYDFSGSNNRGDENSSDNYFLSLRSGLNLGAWRLRNFSTGSYSKTNKYGHDEHWDTLSTYVQRDIKFLRSQLTLGDSYTSSDIFESMQFSGMKLTSDDNMIPDSLRGYAPTVRGIANTNAKVVVKQNNSIIYTTNVPPGPFVINDIYPLTSSGTLQVEIDEADGQVRTSTQAFSTVPIMQREGHLRYAFSAGKTKAIYSGQDKLPFVELSAIYGLPKDITVYGGFQGAKKYKAVAVGAGYSLGEFGSISTDVTQSWATFPNSESKSGQSYRFQYAKTVESTGSTFTLAGYRYSTKGFYDFSEFSEYSSYMNNHFFEFKNNRRSKIQLDYTQRILDGTFGSFSISGYQQDYWNETGSDRALNVSYNNTWNSINWSLMYTLGRYANTETQTDQRLSLMVSIPFDRFLPHSYATMSTSSDSKGNNTYRSGLSGSALDNNLNYSVYEGYSNHGGGNSGGVNAAYTGSSAVVDGGYSYSQRSRQISYGLRGAVIAHPHGITLSQPIDSDLYGITIVAAPGAKGIHVKNNTGVITDSRGYAVIPYNNPYKVNRVALDTTSFGNDVDIDNNVTNVVPTAGAIVYANFKARLGARVLVTFRRLDGSVVPFGSLVSIDGDTNNVAIVGEDGQVYLSGVGDKSEVIASWGKAESDKCRSIIRLPNEKSHVTFDSVMLLKAICQ